MLVIRGSLAESVSIIAVVQMGDVLAVGWNDGCDQFGEDLNHLIIPINILGEMQ